MDRAIELRQIDIPAVLVLMMMLSFIVQASAEGFIFL
jgi:hypothetical protein